MADKEKDIPFNGIAKGRKDILELMQRLHPFPSVREGESTRAHFTRMGAQGRINAIMTIELTVALAAMRYDTTEQSIIDKSLIFYENNPNITASEPDGAFCLFRGAGRLEAIELHKKATESLIEKFADDPQMKAAFENYNTYLDKLTDGAHIYRIFNDESGHKTMYAPSGLHQLTAPSYGAR